MVIFYPQNISLNPQSVTFLYQVMEKISNGENTYERHGQFNEITYSIGSRLFIEPIRYRYSCGIYKCVHNF